MRFLHSRRRAKVKTKQSVCWLCAKSGEPYKSITIMKDSPRERNVPLCEECWSTLAASFTDLSPRPPGVEHSHAAAKKRHFNREIDRTGPTHHRPKPGGSA